MSIYPYKKAKDVKRNKSVIQEKTVAAGAQMMAGKKRFAVRFGGVRGSYPTPGSHTVRHGGNTSCIEVQAGGHTLILDAGSGIIRLGETLLRRAKGRPLHVSLLIT